MVTRLYPNGRRKAFNVSYDDGVEQDVRFVQLLNAYGLKGTFNLNSGLMKQQFAWIHGNGMTVRRLSQEAAASLYEGHEVACHTYSHPYMDDYSAGDILRELGADRFFLEKLFGREVTGYATPFYFYDEQLSHCVQECGFEYARISDTDLSYSPWREYYRWKGGLFHERDELEAYVDGFLETSEELALCQIVGHTYDLDVYDMWDRMEAIFRQVSGAQDVWPATHLEIVRYLKQMSKAEIQPEYVENKSEIDLWFEINGNIHILHPGAKEEIK